MDQRKFTRTPFEVSGTLIVKGESIPFMSRNVSLKGALVHPDAETDIPLHQKAEILIRLHNSDVVIKAEGELVHKEEDALGFRFTLIEDESMIHLRRLLELNTAHPDQIKHELAFLGDV